MKRLFLLRHAPTAWNRDKRIQGRSDVPLSVEGEAEAARWRLPAETVGWRVLASPLLRALETARAMRLAPEPFPPLIEMDWGTLEGRRLAEIRENGGPDFAAAEALGLDFRPGGGETPREVGRRALAGLRDLSGDVVGVTHKGVLRALFAQALGWDMRSKPPLRLDPAAGHLFRLAGDGRLRLERPNIPLAPPPETP